MNISEMIIEKMNKLPKSKLIEVFDFVEYLKQKTERKTDKVWSNFSVSSAMRGMETEESPYSQTDLKEIFS